jgi:hypothetical protein
MIRLTLPLLSIVLILYWRKIRNGFSDEVEITSTDKLDPNSKSKDLSHGSAILTLLFVIASCSYTAYHLITQIVKDMTTLAGFSIYALFNILLLILLIAGRRKRGKDLRNVELDSVIYKSVNDVSTINSGRV